MRNIACTFERLRWPRRAVVLRQLHWPVDSERSPRGAPLRRPCTATESRDLARITSVSVVSYVPPEAFADGATVSAPQVWCERIPPAPSLLCFGYSRAARC